MNIICNIFNFLINKIKKNGLIHTNKFPHNVKEKVALLLITNGKIIYENIVEIESRETVIENKQLMGMAGKYKFKLEVHPLIYRGMELGQDISFEVKPNSTKRKVKNLLIILEKNNVFPFSLNF